MSRCEDIDNTIWDDPDFESLSPYATLLYLWSFTNPRCDMAGIYKVSHAKMTESKVPLECIPAALEELAGARFAFYEDQVLWVRARVKRLRSRSPQMAKAVAKDIRRIVPTHPLRRRFVAEYGSDPWLRDAFREGSSEGIDDLSEKPIGKGDSHTLSGPSREGPGKGHAVKKLNGGSKGKGGVGGRDEDRLPSGFPDCVFVRERVVYAELKGPRTRITDEQVAWMQALLGAGEEVYLWRAGAPNVWQEIERVLGRETTTEGIT